MLGVMRAPRLQETLPSPHIYLHPRLQHNTLAYSLTTLLLCTEHEVAEQEDEAEDLWCTTPYRPDLACPEDDVDVLNAPLHN